MMFLDEFDKEYNTSKVPMITTLINDYYKNLIPSGIVLDFIEDNIEFVEAFNPITSDTKYEALAALREMYEPRQHKTLKGNH